MPRTEIDPMLPTEHDAELAERASRILEAHKAGESGLRLQVAGHEETTLDLPAAAARLLVTILKEMGQGRALSLVPLESEITTQQAADLLNVSRPYLVGLIDKGVLPVRMVGNQRRLPLRGVLAYRSENRAKRREALDELAKLDQEMGLR